MTHFWHDEQGWTFTGAGCRFNTYAEMLMAYSQLCQDEGCDHHGTPHVCATSVEVVTDNPATEVEWQDRHGLSRDETSCLLTETDKPVDTGNGHTVTTRDLSTRVASDRSMVGAIIGNERGPLTGTIKRLAGVPIDGGQAYRENLPIGACPYSNRALESLSDFTRWNEEWRAAQHHG